MLWTHFDSSPHTVTSGAPDDDAGAVFDSGTLQQGDTFPFTFDEAGEFTYFCDLHEEVPALVGATVTVE